jgi:lipopolysaccharide export system permease protein
MLRIIKKLDIFILKSFAFLFIGTFFICLFIFMMQFLWRNVDEMVGKGLEVSALMEFFYYSALSLVPISLPLAILLASLITFGNFGERFELLAMKAAGIPLLRIMRPLIIFVGLICCASFYFQNVTTPNSQIKLYTLLYSMKQKSPELDIPEGAFYNEIDGYNLYIKKKDKKTGMLYGVTIYNMSDGFENAHILVADSGKMEITADKKYLQLHLYSGEQFENLRQQSMSSQNVPYRRESFVEKHTLIAFDTNFNLMDANLFSAQAGGKNMIQLSHDVDSMTQHYDSIGRTYYKETMDRIPAAKMSAHDSTQWKQSKVARVDMDSLIHVSGRTKEARMVKSARERVNILQNELAYKAIVMKEGDKTIRKHQLEWYNKIVLSLSCLVFFFIGAPLGAIIRKGGLGMPVIISIVIFLIYYIVNTMGTKLAKEGSWTIFLGSWISTMVLAPLGVFFTYKSNKDSVVFNVDAYIALLRKILGLRSDRHITKKEVIIEDPDYGRVYDTLTEMSATCTAYAEEHKFNRAPNYYKVFTNDKNDVVIARLSEQLEAVVEELSNSKNNKIILQLNNYPILIIGAHKSPFSNRWLNILSGLVVPVGLFFYFRIWRFGRRLDRDLRNITETNQRIQAEIDESKLK